MDYHIKHFEVIDSTNAFANALINDNPPEEGLVIWADDQINGKGHGSNTWESEKGKNLLFSLVLKPYMIKPADQFIITQMISVAILNLLSKNILKHPVNWYMIMLYKSKKEYSSYQ